MASKFRPKGNYKAFLSMTSEQISKLSYDELKGITAKLQDVANKRIDRLTEIGIENFSPSIRGRKSHGRNPHFTMSRSKMDRSKLLGEYLKVRRFVSDDKISGDDTTITGAYTAFEDYVALNQENLKKILDLKEFRGKETISAEDLYDKRKKKKVLRESVRKRINEFWQKYEQWKEVMMNKNPDYFKDGTNDNTVNEFVEEIYKKRKTNVDRMQRYAAKKYEEKEAKENGEDIPVQPSTTDERATRPIVKNQQQERRAKVKPIKTKFEKIKIF